MCFWCCPPERIHPHIPQIGQHGYWFDPPPELTGKSSFELICEQSSGLWRYYGRYRTFDLQPFDAMQLSEWLQLTEEIRATHCWRVAVVAHMKDDLNTKVAANSALRTEYDAGIARMRAGGLEFLGFTREVFEAVQAVSSEFRHGHTVAPSPAPTGKRPAESKRKAAGSTARSKRTKVVHRARSPTPDKRDIVMKEEDHVAQEEQHSPALVDGPGSSVPEEKQEASDS